MSHQIDYGMLQTTWSYQSKQEPHPLLGPDEPLDISYPVCDILTPPPEGMAIEHYEAAVAQHFRRMYPVAEDRGFIESVVFTYRRTP